MDCSGAEHHGVRIELLAVDDDASRPAAVDDDPIDKGVAPNGEVGPRSRMLEVGVVGRDAPSVAQG